MERPANVTGMVREIFRQYLEDVREIVVVTGRCFLKGWPDRKAAIAVSTRIGHLNCDFQLLRFDYLVDNGLLEPGACKAISAIYDRVWKDWKESDEAALKDQSERYRDVLARLDADRAVLDSPALDGPSRDAMRDPKYLKAAEDLRQKYWALETQLQNAVSNTAP
jgi:hypothetical protein